MNPSNFQLWCPDVFEGRGGIQVFSRFFVDAVRQIHPSARCEVMVKHDTRRAADSSSVPNARFHVTGDWPAPLRTLAFAEQLFRLGLAKRPDLIISTHLNFAGPALWLKRAAGIPYWLVAHGIEAWDIKRPMVRRALHEAERVLAVSHFTRDRLIKNERLNPRRIALLPDTFDAGRFTIAPKPEHLLQRYNLSPDQPVILTVSRLCSAEQYKGYDKILDAMVRIRTAVPRVRYILAGRGDDRKRIERQILALGLEDAVTLAGFVPDEELSAHYNLCDVFAMPSKGEGFGIVFLEALACGKPALAGNKDGSVDALCNGELGALVDPDDTGMIAESLIQLLLGSYPNPLMYQPEKIREQVVRTYGYDRFTQTLAGLFEDFFSAQRKVA